MNSAPLKAVWVHAAGALGAAGYAVLAWQAGGWEARPWLALALVLGWMGVGVLCWRSSGPRWVVVVWAVVFRLIGVTTEPSWEDDYHRYLWDGYQTLITGNPYDSTPADSFGSTELPEVMADRLDGINHPDVPTIYGPVPQVVFAAAAWLRWGDFAVLKLLLLAAEATGWWLLGRRLDWRGWVLVWWCPLGVTEIAFAGHPEALGVAALALALAGWLGANRTGSAVGTALATATKPFGAVLGPFVVARFGWRAAALGLVVWGGLYLLWWWQGSWAEWPAVRLMGQVFEYNSTGFAVLGWLLPDAVARGAAGAIVVGCAGCLFWRWAREDRTALPPVAAIMAVAFACAPVMNPWYALWLLPAVAIQRKGWGVGILFAVPLAYTHGWGAVGGVGTDYTHAAWVRPVEVALVLVVWLAARKWPSGNRS